MRRIASIMPTMWKPCLVLVVALSACDSESATSDALIENYSPPGGGLVWTCPDGTSIALSDEVSKQSTLCLGIDGSECRENGVPGPGDPECDDPNFNGFKNTCVEEFFSCFQPSGTCNIVDNGNQEWGNGAVQNRNYMNFLTSYFPLPGEDPCITAVNTNGRVIYR